MEVVSSFSMHSRYEKRKIKIDRKIESHVVHSIQVYFKEKWCVCVCVCILDLYAS